MQNVITVKFPDGRILADSQFKSAEDALCIALGWPGPDEVREFYRQGGRVMRCNLGGMILPAANPCDVYPQAAQCD